MRKAKLLIGIGCLMACVISPAAFAQDYAKFDVFVGYSLMLADEFDNIDWVSDNAYMTINGERVPWDKSGFLGAGFSTSLTYNFHSVIGLETSIRYNTGYILGGKTKIEHRDGTIDIETGLKRKDFAFLIGPRFTFRISNRVTPFAHVLAGLSHDSVSSTMDARRGGESLDTGSNNNENLNSNTSYGVALGGGLDIWVNETIGIRAIQADYYMTNHPAYLQMPARFNTSFPDENKQFNNINLSFGLVFRF